MDNIASGVEDLLRRVSTVIIRCPVDHARGDLPAATNLQWSIPNY